MESIDMNNEKILNAISNLSEEAAEKIISALVEDCEQDAALELIKEYGESIIVANDGNAEVEYAHCDTLNEAANEYVEDGDWGDDRSKTDWVDVYAWHRWKLGEIEIDEERECFTVEIKPEEPECTEGNEHEWCSPFDVLGGIKENPGVWGNAGGVIIHEVCRHCGCLKTTDTWAQRSDTGEQGLTSVEYDDGDHRYTEAWVEWKESN
jgi:hypothetical protein